MRWKRVQGQGDMLLADFAQVSDGKLTVVGGGWSLTGPEAVPFGIAILIRVPWDQANQRHVMSGDRLRFPKSSRQAIQRRTWNGRTILPRASWRQPRLP